MLDHEGKISAEYLTETVSRSFYHDVRGEDALKSGERWAVDEDFIPRYKSTATIVIEGIAPVADSGSVTAADIVPQYIMWTGLGYPPCSEIVPVWCHENEGGSAWYRSGRDIADVQYCEAAPRGGVPSSQGWQ